MHFELALDLSDIDLWNIDLLDTHLDLLVTDTRVSIFFVSITSSKRLQDMSSRHLPDMSSRRLQDMSSGRLQDVFILTIFRLQDVFRTSCKMSSRCLRRRKIVTLKACWRRLQDMSWRGLDNVFKTNKCLLGYE